MPLLRFLFASVLVLFTVAACKPSRPGDQLAAGEWSLDLEASVEATMPVWKSEVGERMQAELDGMVKKHVYTQNKAAYEGDLIASQLPSIVTRELSTWKVELTVEDATFELRTDVPDHNEHVVNGTCVVAQDNTVYLVRQRVDGIDLPTESKTTASVDDQGRLLLPWGELFRLVLVHDG